MSANLKSITTEKDEQIKSHGSSKTRQSVLELMFMIFLYQELFQRKNVILQKQVTGAEEFSKDSIMACDRSKRVTIDLSREIDR